MSDAKSKKGGIKEARQRLGKPRRRAVPVWRRRPVVGAAAMVLAAGIAGAGWWSWHSGAVHRLAEQAKWQAIAWSADLGLHVNEILVVGRRETSQADLLDALRVTRGAPILAFDMAAAKKRVESLPWVRTASVERMLPGTVLLNIEERTPLALWQHDGRFALIDHDGTVILRDGLERFRDLLLVVGENAPQHAKGLVEALSSEPDLMRMVRAAVRVGGRRWNLRLDGGIDVRLPEENAVGAWMRLAEYERSHGVLERDVRVLDLRLPDRLIVRKAPSDGYDGKGQET